MAHSEEDQIIVTRLTRVARRIARWRVVTSEREAQAVKDLREIAGDRSDLLAEVAGLALGFGETQGDAIVLRHIAVLCAKAGADPEQVREWIEVGRHRSGFAGIPPATVGRPRYWH